MRVGVLALQGGVSEHMDVTGRAAERLKIGCEAVPVRTAAELKGLHGLILPGGESTTLAKLCAREGMFEAMKCIPAIFGTCAGAIMLAKAMANGETEQKTLGLMDISVDRNAYGQQSESFEETLKTKLGTVNAVFIRAPRITRTGPGVSVLAERNGGPVACEQTLSQGRYLLATCFHPELSTTVFHEHFLKIAASGPG